MHLFLEHPWYLTFSANLPWYDRISQKQEWKYTKVSVKSNHFMLDSVQNQWSFSLRQLLATDLFNKDPNSPKKQMNILQEYYHKAMDKRSSPRPLSPDELSYLTTFADLPFIQESTLTFTVLLSYLRFTDDVFWRLWTDGFISLMSKETARDYLKGKQVNTALIRLSEWGAKNGKCLITIAYVVPPESNWGDPVKFELLDEGPQNNESSNTFPLLVEFINLLRKNQHLIYLTQTGDSVTYEGLARRFCLDSWKPKDEYVIRG